VDSSTGSKASQVQSLHRPVCMVGIPRRSFFSPCLWWTTTLRNGQRLNTAICAAFKPNYGGPSTFRLIPYSRRLPRRSAHLGSVYTSYRVRLAYNVESHPLQAFIHPAPLPSRVAFAFESHSPHVPFNPTPIDGPYQFSCRVGKRRSVFSTRSFMLLSYSWSPQAEVRISPAGHNTPRWGTTLPPYGRSSGPHQYRGS